MKSFVLWTFLLTLCHVAQSRPNVIQLLQLSVNPDATTTSLMGSVNGGTVIYIRALGLDPVLGNNQVTVGPYQCRILDIDASGQFISCETAAATDPSQLTNLEIQVSSKSKRPGVCKLQSCLFSYQLTNVATVYSIVPRTAIPESILNILASHPSSEVVSNQV